MCPMSVRSSWQSSDPRVYVPRAGAHEKSMGVHAVRDTGQGHEQREKLPSPVSQAHLHVCRRPKDTLGLSLVGGHWREGPGS